MKPILLVVFLGGVMCYRNEDKKEGGTNEPKHHLKQGHKQPLGEQHECMGHIDVLDHIPSPIAFYNDYIKTSKPVVFKNAAKNIPAFKLWTDEYLKEEFGNITVDIEEGKKENRSLNLWNWDFSKFLDKYQTSDIYMVHSLPKQMRKDLSVLPVISCGGYTNVLADVILWFSSGGTKSVLHNDHIDNINCLFAGRKQLYMVDYRYKKHIKFDAPAGGFSNVDVDAVDLNKYPGIGKEPWWRADMQAGDCLFIPSRWFHQVRSFAENNRNMAVNVWFYNMKKINQSECETGDHVGKFLPMIDFATLKEKGEMANGVKFLLSLDVGEEKLSYKQMYKIMKTHNDEVEKSYIKQALVTLDKNRDKLISKEDIEKLTTQELNGLSYLYPGITMEEPEDEDESYGEEQDQSTEDGGDRDEL